MAYKKNEKGYGYGKMPLWKWIVIYLIVGGIIYALVYYFFFSKGGSGIYKY